MIQEPLDFKRAVQLLMRHKIVMLASIVLGLVAGAGFALLRPPMLTSQALVLLPPTTRGGVGTQVVIAGSDDVLGSALKKLPHGVSLDTLRNQVTVDSRTATILAFSAKGKTAADAKDTANSVAWSYVNFVRRPGSLPDGTIQAQILQPAKDATGTKATPRMVGIGLVGAALGAVLAAFGVLTVSRRDRRLWERDAIADSIGVPVVASIAVNRAPDAASWRTLLQDYRPSAVDGWRLRKALQYLGMGELAPNGRHGGTRLSLTVLSLSFDRRALALGPQLAVFAASRGIPTALVIGPQQDIAATATLRAACIAPAAQASSQLRLVVKDHPDAAGEPDVALTVVVSVVDAERPEATDLIPTTSTVLAVSAGVASADQLARAAASAAAGGQEIAGILVADPDPADTTTGRLPQVGRSGQRRRPTRLTGTTMENR